MSGDADGAVWSPDGKRFLFTTQVYPECSVKGGRDKAESPTHRDEAAMNGARMNLAGMETATWAEEDACDKAKDEAAASDSSGGEYEQ